MKFTKRKLLGILLAVLLLCGIGYLCNPMLRVKTFVAVHGKELEMRIQNAEEVSNYQMVDGKLVEASKMPSSEIPSYMGINSFDIWTGEHDMIEFRLFAVGLVPSSTYYGCYYSYDDVPLAFQNMDAALVQNGHNYWQWQAEGDNHGATRKIREHWYYFEASF